MSSTIGNVSSLISSATDVPYSASAKVNDGGVDVSSTTTTGDETTRTVSKDLGKDDFLKLLIAQLQYQDPLNPMDNTQFISQMAQFSALESTNNVEKAIKDLNTSFTGSVDAQKRSSDAMSSTAAISLIGKSVRMQVKDIKWTDAPGEKIDIPVYIGGNSEATVEIRDSTGTVVKSMVASDKDSQNTVNLVWDGKKENGDTVEAGAYTIHIAGEENDSGLYAFIEDVVTGVRFTDNNAMLKIHGMELPLGSILDVASGSETAQSQSLVQGSAVSLLGKTVRVQQSEVAFSQGENETMGIKVNAAPNSTVQVNINNADGETIKTVSGSAGADGVAFLTWDGTLDAGGLAPVGEYAIDVNGSTSNSSLYAFIEGTVEGVSNLAGNTLVRIAGVSFRVSDIIDISQPKAV